MVIVTVFRLGEARHWLDGGCDVVTAGTPIQIKLHLHATPGTLSRFSTQ